MTETAQLISAVARLLWPVLLAVILFVLRHRITEIVVEFMGTKLVIKPAQAIRLPAEVQDSGVAEFALASVDARDPLPVDYYFLNHTSFLRPHKQEEFRARTGVNRPHYDIHVIVDSYYEGALGRVKYVEYVLHQAYPESIQVRSRAADRFLLKELANGEYVLVAKVYLTDRKAPVLLQRYITLWKEGPRLDDSAKRRRERSGATPTLEQESKP